VVTQLRELLAHRAAYAAQNRQEDWFDAAQNARIVRAAEQYYRLMFQGGTSSWNLRDRHMFDTLKYVLEARGPQAKAVVWAHNSTLATPPPRPWAGRVSSTSVSSAARPLAKARRCIGFGTDRGTGRRGGQLGRAHADHAGAPGAGGFL
jgi:erythromycin esterase-like protein